MKAFARYMCIINRMGKYISRTCTFLGEHILDVEMLVLVIVEWNSDVIPREFVNWMMGGCRQPIACEGAGVVTPGRRCYNYNQEWLNVSQ